MKKQRHEPAHVSTTSVRPSEFLVSYLKPDGYFSEANRDELQRILREELNSNEPLGKVIRGAHGTLTRRELAKRVRQSHCKTTNLPATDILIGYLRPRGVFSSENRDELQRMLSEDMGSREFLGRIIRGDHGTALRLELAERAQQNRKLNSY